MTGTGAPGGLLRATRTMAAGTAVSRATGFLRTAVVVGVLGVAGVGDAFTVANTAPNIVYELLLGGLLSSVVVPLLVRSARDGGDGGEAFAQRLLSLTVLVLGASLLGGAAVLSYASVVRRVGLTIAGTLVLLSAARRLRTRHRGAVSLPPDSVAIVRAEAPSTRATA